MPTRDDLFPSRWLKATDVEPPVVTTVDHCTLEVVGRNTADRKLVMHFQHDALKPLPLNNTNFTTMETITGCPESDEWGGTVIELFAVDTTDPKGTPTKGVRIRRPKSSRKTAPPPSKRKDDIDQAMPTLGADDAF